MTEVRVRGAHATVRAEGLEDEVAVEEPLEIRVDGRPLAVTMRTPGHDEELALGFLYGEGLIGEVRDAAPPADLAGNTVEVAGPLLREPSARSFFTSSSCGVCGKGALEEVAVHAAPIADGPARGARAASPERALRVRAAVVRARAEGGRGRLAAAGGRGRADVARRDARRRPRADPLRVRPRGPRERLHLQQPRGLRRGRGRGSLPQLPPACGHRVDLRP